MNLIIEKYLDYLRNVRVMRPRSVNDYIASLKYLSEEIDPLKAESRGDVRGAILRMKDKRGWCAVTAGHHSIRIKNFYDWASSERLIPFNPYPMSEFKRPRSKRPEFITSKEYETIKCDVHLTQQDRALLSVLWDCAPRVSELCSLTQGEVDFETNCIHIPCEKSKGGYSDRYVPFTPETRQILQVQFEFVRGFGHHKTIFINSHWKALDVRDVAERISEIGKRRTPIRDPIHLTPHVFRHSFAMRMLELGMPEIIVQKFLGHTSLSMTSHYSHFTRENSLNFFQKYVLEKSIA